VKTRHKPYCGIDGTDGSMTGVVAEPYIAVLPTNPSSRFAIF
jgi:hypothetical protein